MSKAKTSKKLRPFDEARYSTDDTRARDRTREDVVAELAGVLSGSDSDPREEYTEYLRKKYS